MDPAVQLWLGWTPGLLLFWIMAAMAGGTLGTAIYRTTWIARHLGQAQ